MMRRKMLSGCRVVGLTMTLAKHKAITAVTTETISINLFL